MPLLHTISDASFTIVSTSLDGDKPTSLTRLGSMPEEVRQGRWGQKLLGHVPHQLYGTGCLSLCLVIFLEKSCANLLNISSSLV